MRFVAPIMLALAAPVAGAQHWPQFRGPHASGVCDAQPLVSSFDVETGENVRWRRAIPGLAHSSPIVWGDRLFVTTAVRLEGEASLEVGLYGNVVPVPDEGMHDFRVYCLDKHTGEVVWDRTAVTAVPKVQRHTKGSHAASSPATDGQRVVAFFASEGLYCYDLDGNLKWSRDLGVMDSAFYMMPGTTDWGYSASPIVYDGNVIMQCDLVSRAFLVMLDGETGEDVWRVERDELPTWSTPSVAVRDGRAQVICNGCRHMGGYDVKTGAELWSLAGAGDIPVPTPLVWNDRVFLTSAHGNLAPIYAVDLMAEGAVEPDPEDAGMRWMEQARRGNYMQTPVVYRDVLFCCRDNGVLRAFDARTGEILFQDRLGGGSTGFTASGVAGDGKVYFTSEAGEVFVVRADDMIGIGEMSELGEECMSTPAISDGTVYFRSRRHVTAIGSTPAPEESRGE